MNKSALLKQLATDDLSDATRDAVLQAGAKAVPALLEILGDTEQWGKDEDADGAAALHAAALLGELNATAALEPMLGMLAVLEPFGALAQCIVESLGHMGAVVMEPTLERYNATDEEDDGFDFLEVLARCGVQDPRIFKALTAAFKQAPGDIAPLLGRYGDAAALPLLIEKLDGTSLQSGPAGLENALDCTELLAAIVVLGGELTAEQKDKQKVAVERVLEAGLEEAAEEVLRYTVEHAVESPAAAHVHGPHCTHDHGHDHDHDAAPQEPRVRAREKVGRNDPCWCSSGKKYKKCHYETDQRALY